MKTSYQGFIIPLLLVAVAILIGGGIYLYIQDRKISSPLIANPTSQTSISVPQATSSSPTASWKTYKNQDRGFEMQYPADWTSSPDVFSAGSHADGTPVFSLSILGTDYTLQIMDGANPSETKQGSVEKNITYLNARAGRIVVTDGDAMPIGNGKAFYSLESVPGDLLPTALLVGKNEILQMQMTAVYSAGSGNSSISSQQGEALFKEILSTFKFNQ